MLYKWYINCILPNMHSSETSDVLIKTQKLILSTLTNRQRDCFQSDCQTSQCVVAFFLTTISHLSHPLHVFFTILVNIQWEKSTVWGHNLCTPWVIACSGFCLFSTFQSCASLSILYCKYYCMKKHDICGSGMVTIWPHSAHLHSSGRWEEPACQLLCTVLFL